MSMSEVTLHGNESLSSIKYSQVYQATHEGEKRLPFMNRSFISFSFDGKHIEDFDLIATFSSDRLNKDGYSSFEDITSTYDNLNGQYYWNTHYRASTLEFTLSTDGIDQKKLDEFLHLFRAGNTKELILAEHPNRATLARVSSPPRLNLLPFEKQVLLPIGEETYSTSTTLYKGDIQLSFTLDQPHWYAKMGVLGKLNEQTNRYEDLWHDDEENIDISVFESKDALKILYEDGIPLGSMIQNTMMLGNGTFANVDEDTQINSKVWSLDENEIVWTGNAPTGTPSGVGARVEYDSAEPPYTWGVIAGAIITDTSNLTLKRVGDNDSQYPDTGYFFYSGNAPAPVELSFILTPNFNSDGYIDTPANSYALSISNKPYNVILIESTDQQQFYFTTPNLYTSYNKVVNILRTNIFSESTKSWLEIKNMIREDVRHPVVRAWAVAKIQTKENTLEVTSTLAATELINDIQALFKSSGEVQSAKFTFNSETGKATGEFKYQYDGGLSTIIEDVGDMVRSNYIVIQEKNEPDPETHVIKAWEAGKTKNSHRIQHDVSTELHEVSVLYKNMYL